MNFKVESTGWSWCEIQHQKDQSLRISRKLLNGLFPLQENRTQKQDCETKGCPNDAQESGEQKETFVKMKYVHSLTENFSPWKKHIRSISESP